ncbi:MAG: signal peptidase I [Rhodothermaceae bacterium]
MAKNKTGKQAQSKKERFIAVAREYTILILIAFFVASSIIQGSLVPTGSMESTINVGDFILVNRLAYDFYTPRNVPHTNLRLPFARWEWSDGPEKGDIVVFEFPGYQGNLEHTDVQSWVKRCVGVPGDTIVIRDRVLFVNGKEFPIPANIRYENKYSHPVTMPDQEIFPRNEYWNTDNYGPVVVPGKGEEIKLTTENLYRYEDLINREYGKRVVRVKDDKIFINGKETDTFTIKQNYYFMVGDNRNNSADSRVWGFVPRDKILGEPMFVFFSFDSSIPFSNFFKLLGSIRFNRIGKIL